MGNKDLLFTFDGMACGFLAIFSLIDLEKLYISSIKASRDIEEEFPQKLR
jgi:hypothetical protein